MVTVKVCVLASGHWRFVGCKMDKSCVKEALPVLVAVYVRQLTIVESDLSANEDISVASWVFWVETDGMQNRREEEIWSLPMGLALCILFLNMYPVFTYCIFTTFCSFKAIQISTRIGLLCREATSRGGCKTAVSARLWGGRNQSDALVSWEPVVFPTVFRSFEIHHRYWKRLVGIPCPLHIVLVNLTSFTNFADHDIVRFYALYHTDMFVARRVDGRSHDFHGYEGPAYLSMFVEIKVLDINL